MDIPGQGTHRQLLARSGISMLSRSISMMTSSARHEKPESACELCRFFHK
jgi:hypothetical protein